MHMIAPNPSAICQRTAITSSLAKLRTLNIPNVSGKGERFLHAGEDGEGAMKKLGLIPHNRIECSLVSGCALRKDP